MAEPRTRLLFLDGLRGVALILMVVNHTARWWIDVSMGWGRYYLVYLSMTLPAPLFLFLVGFCLPIAFRRRGPEGRPPFLAGMAGYVRRGLTIFLAGYLLNLVVFPEDPVWSGGVLQTIGLSIIVTAPAIWVLDRRRVRYSVVALAAIAYVVFAWAMPALTEWLPTHSLAAQMWFLDFPPWPWIGAALVGLVLGWSWLDARQRGAEAEARYFRTAVIVGVACLVAFVAWEWFAGTSPRIAFSRDIMLNRHWTPRGSTLLGIAGMVALLLAAAYYVMEVRKQAFPWLVVLGQTALMLYFLHQLIVLTLINQALGQRFNHWGLYIAANVLLLVALVYIGKAWLYIKRRARPPAVAPASAG